MYNTHEIDLSSPHTNQELDLGHEATIIRVISHDGDAEIALGSGAPMLPVTHIGQKFRLGCEGGKRKGVQRIYYTNAAGSGTVELLSSDDETDVDFSAASTPASGLEIVLATIVPRAIGASLLTSDPKWDTTNPLTHTDSGDGYSHLSHDGTNEVIGAEMKIPVGGTNYSHAGGKLAQYALPLAQLLNTQGLTNHRGRDWYVELADSIYSVFTGSNLIYRGIGFGEINNTVGGWQKPFVGLYSGKNSYWRLYAKDAAGIRLDVSLPGYDPAEIHAVKVRIGQEAGAPYLEAWMDGALAHRETLPLAADLQGLGSFPLNPWMGCARALGADTVELWGLLDGAMTLKLVYPEG